MSIFSCKMCGGNLEIHDSETVGVCDSCGTKQTLPRLDSDKKINLYDRAGHFRRNNDFDKAMGIYEQILNEDSTDAEAYWSLVLCRYGIEYVEDPMTRQRIPTINRIQYTSIFADEDYKAALEYSTGAQKVVYEQEAQTIDQIQRRYLTISEQEEPFDVFICYKETATDGRRTRDSVIANDLYYQLTKEGFRVFFARITLEDKLGQEYEPYIFSALNSAKVMIVLGTCAEFFEAVWVKNEWSRYLAMIKAGQDKTLIPAYRDMDPYDLPDEFSHLQAQDMSKLGFMQDLIRGIKKITSKAQSTTGMEASMSFETAVNNYNALLKRAFIFLEDGNFEKADDFCEQVLNQDPENAQAYLGKLMAELHVTEREKLADCKAQFVQRDNYKKIMRFGDEAIKTEMTNYNYEIQYRHSIHLFEQINTVEDCNHVKESFETIKQYKDASEWIDKCVQSIYQRVNELLERCSVAEQLDRAVQYMSFIENNMDVKELKEKTQEQAEKLKKQIEYNEQIYSRANELRTNDDVESIRKCVEMLQEIRGYRDSEKIIGILEKRIFRINRTEAYREKLSQIAEERRYLYEENSTLSIFKNVRKKEIQNRLKELNQMEQALSIEYQDVK